MSLPSVVSLALSMGIDIETATEEQTENLLVAAMKQDLSLAWEHMHQLAHRAQNDPAHRIVWSEDPNSPLGKQLIRIHTDALRPLLIKHAMHNVLTTFVNCCGGAVVDEKNGGKKLTAGEIQKLQIQMQNGDLASPDC